MFKKHLKLLREEKSLTQEQLAKILDLSQQTIGHYESGKARPGFDTLCKIADYFDVTTDYLLGRTTFRKGRIVTNEELKQFLPADLAEKNKIEIWVDDAELDASTKREIIKILKKHDYIK